MRWIYAQTLYKDKRATLDELREAVTTLEDLALTARRVFGKSHPLTEQIEDGLRIVRLGAALFAELRARETPSASA